MRGIILVSHGGFAEALKESLHMIAGEFDNVYAFGLEPADGPESFTEKLNTIDKELEKYDEILVFTDLYGGSPGNAAFVKYIMNDKYQIISGMNFPMVLTAVLSESETPESLLATGQEGIVNVREFMKSTQIQQDDE